MDRKCTVLAGILVVSISTTALACLWDYDTLQMERLRFPGFLEIITGKFIRHSQSYYEWRIIDRTKKLERAPGDPALIDDLAVAYAKLGRPEEGITLLRTVLASHPHRYETLANLGTLQFFAGRLDESAELIRQAIEINPDAHFGRERYQLLLTEYLLQSEWKTTGVMSNEERFPLTTPTGFARYVLETHAKNNQLKYEPHAVERSPQETAELRSAAKGVLGMMHFADHRSPILLEALGDLLLADDMEKNVTQLAARAYLRAAQRVDDPFVAGAFRKMAREALANHIDFHEKSDELALLEPKFANEVKAADAWFAAIEAREKQWIAEGGDVDRQFAATYYVSLENTVAAAESTVRSEPREVRLSHDQRIIRRNLIGSLICAGIPTALISLAIFAVLYRRRRRLLAPVSAKSPAPFSG